MRFGVKLMHSSYRYNGFARYAHSNRYGMVSLTLLEIERSIYALPPEEQLWLLERIARHLREQTNSTTQPSNHQNRLEELSAMACDPDIKAELVAINKEFAMTEMDGLTSL